MAFAVVLDANVLYPIALTDFFLTLAGYGLYRPHWSTEILREAGRNLLEKNPNINEDQLEYRFGEMNRAHPGALANPPPELIPVMTNDPKDRHVLAAAQSCLGHRHLQHQALLPEACEPHGVEAQHPDVFAEHLVDLDPAAAARALEEMSGRTQNPHREVQEIVARLGEDLPKAMGRLEQLGGHAPAP